MIHPHIRFLSWMITIHCLCSFLSFFKLLSLLSYPHYCIGLVLSRCGIWTFNHYYKWYRQFNIILRNRSRSLAVAQNDSYSCSSLNSQPWFVLSYLDFKKNENIDIEDIIPKYNLFRFVNLSLLSIAAPSLPIWDANDWLCWEFQNLINNNLVI